MALLERAAVWGRTDLEALCGSWYGESSSWPEIAPTGVSLRRAPGTFPPSGAQPGNAAVFRPSWRRYGTGESASGSDKALSYTIDLSDVARSATIRAVQEMIDERAPDADWPNWWEPEWVDLAEYVQAGGDESDEAAFLLGSLLIANAPDDQDDREQFRSDFFSGDFQGLEGISRLEVIVAGLDPGDGRDDEMLVEALTALADLYRRHGGRHDDVVSAYERALAIVRRLAGRPVGDDDYDSTPMLATDLAVAWWQYTHRRRDVTELIALSGKLSVESLPLENYARPLWLGTESVIGFARDNEPNVALDLYRAMIEQWVRTADESGRVPKACAVLAQELAQVDRVDEAIELCEQAWRSEFADQNVANRHSLILERQKLDAESAVVAERGLSLADSDYREPLEKRVARCRKRLGA